MLDAVLTKPSVGPVHVAHDDGHVLEPPVIAARAERHGPPLGGEVFDQLDRLVAEPHADRAHAEPEDALELFVLPAPYLDVGDLLEAEHLGVEGDRPVGVGHGHPDRAHRADDSLCGGLGVQSRDPAQEQGSREGQDQRELSALHTSRPLRRSATRSALAMMVSAGFTAALDGKKLPSTT